MPKPPKPDRPRIAADGPWSLRIGWAIPEAEPEVSACTVKVRIVGSQRWQNYDHATGRLITKGGSTVPVPTCDVTASGCEEGLAYEAVVAMMNSEGWGDVSPASEPVTIGEPKPREKPPAPNLPKLVAMGSGKMKCSWTIPRACPPVEASQVQVTDVGSGLQLLVESASGKLVPSGRTTFAATRCETNILGISDGVEYAVAVCCRNAEGFGDYSPLSDSAVAVDPRVAATSTALVLHQGGLQEAPRMEPLLDGQMRVRWSLPEEAKKTMVKLRRVGDNNWYLCGGTAMEAPAVETVAHGLEEGIQYEAMVSFLIGGKWCSESPISQPACIGELKQPGIPGIPKEPKLLVVDANAREGQMRVRWQAFTAVPPLTGTSVRFRAVGARTWQYVSAISRQVIDEEPDPVPVPALEVDVLGLVPGVRYEASIAFRNRLGQGPFSQPSEVVSIGRPAPRLVRCTYCFADFDLQHTVFSKSLDTFWCPPCRFRHMDPFNAVVEPHGLIFCHSVVRPTVAFSLDVPDLKAWRRDDHSVFMRMVRIDSDNSANVWPFRLSLEANGYEVFSIKEPEEGHVRRDIPKDIAAGLRPGMNSITIKVEDEYIAGYAMALVRTQTRTALQIAADTPHCSAEAAKNRIMTLLANTWSTPLDHEEEEDDITCVISNKLKLRCPLSFERVVIPVRGDACMHLQCFGLGAYLESNMKMRALNNRWTCPVCGTVLKPSDLRIDGYVERVLSETPSHVEEVLLMQDGSYRIVEELAEKVLTVKERMVAAEAAAVARSLGTPADGALQASGVGELTEMPTTIDDWTGNLPRGAVNAENEPPLKKRRRQKLMTVEEEADSDA